MDKNPDGHSPRWWRKHPRIAQEVSIAQRRKAKEPLTKNDKFNDVLGLVSFAFTVASWGWTVIAPDSSALFGSFLLLVAVLASLAAIFRLWPMRIITGALLAIAALSGFGAFDWYVVIKPQKGKQFKALLVDGYHVASECEGIPGPSQMPEWMRDQSKAWQARTEQLI